MTDAPFSSNPVPSPSVDQGRELEVDLAAFLPEGVELGAETVDEPADASAPVDGHEAVEAAAAPAPVVDVEALSQIERDLDAVDAALAALDAGTYGIDPATGAPIDDAVLAQDPTRIS